MSILAREKFELRLLKASDVLKCEDSGSSRLVERFESEKVLYNPLIVARYDGKFIHIDGANRFEALKKLDCKTILTKLVDYADADVQLRSWYHFVSEFTIQELAIYLNESGLVYHVWNMTEVPNGKNWIGVISTNDEAICNRFTNDLGKMLHALSSLNRYYESGFSYTKIDSGSDINDISSLSPDDVLLIVYPEFRKEDIVKTSGFNQKLQQVYPGILSPIGCFT
ncbi:MAG: hypothetical protein K8I03_16350 [Ignavibacteria bacterium]|nr:hypothetical protein [Ignavibacteria bacterium]